MNSARFQLILCCLVLLVQCAGCAASSSERTWRSEKLGWLTTLMVSRDGAYRLEIKNGSSSRQSILDTFSDSVGTARDGSPLFAYVAGEDGRSLSTTASSPGGWWSNCILSSEAFGPDLPQNRLIEP